MPSSLTILPTRKCQRLPAFYLYFFALLSAAEKQRFNAASVQPIECFPPRDDRAVRQRLHFLKTTSSILFCSPLFIDPPCTPDETFWMACGGVGGLVLRDCVVCWYDRQNRYNTTLSELFHWQPNCLLIVRQGKARLFIQHLSTQGNSKCFTQMKDIKKMAF